MTVPISWLEFAIAQTDDRMDSSFSLGSRGATAVPSSEQLDQPHGVDGCLMMTRRARRPQLYGGRVTRHLACRHNNHGRKVSTQPTESPDHASS